VSNAVEIDCHKLHTYWLRWHFPRFCHRKFMMEVVSSSRCSC